MTGLNKQIRNERREIIANVTEIQKNEENTMNRFMLTNWIEEMDKFLETYNLPRLNQEEWSKQADHLQRKLNFQ